MDIVIQFDKDRDVYKIFERSTETLLISPDLTEGLLNLNKFLTSEHLIPEGLDLLGVQDITYHFDSYVMGKIIQSNIELMSRLRQGPSEFKTSSEKFVGITKKPEFGKGSRNFSSGSFSGKSNFKSSRKKWIT